MAGTVSANLTVISLCDATTNWTSLTGTQALNDPTVFSQIEGNYCLQNYSAGAAARGARYDLGAIGTNLQNTNIYCWFATSKKSALPNYGANGMRIRLTDNVGVWSEWDIFGADTLLHADWIPWTIRTNVTSSRDSSSGASNLALIRYVGWQCGAVLAKTYIYFDAWRYGSGLTVHGGTAALPATFEDFVNSESISAWGVISKQFGIYFAQGQLLIGTLSAGTATYFKDTSQVIVFKDQPVGQSFYEIKVQGNSTSATQIYFGEKSGTRGISGILFKRSAVTSAPYIFTADDSNITNLGIYGSTFQNAKSLSFPTYSSTREVLTTTFEACSSISASTCTIDGGSNFLNSNPLALVLSTTGHNVKNSNFISNLTATVLSSSGTYTFNNLKFSNNTIDIFNSSNGLVTINSVDGADPSTTAGNGVNINNAVTVYVKTIDANNIFIPGVKVYIKKISDNSIILNNVTNALSGEISTSYNYLGDTNVSISIRKSSTGATRYVPVETTGVIRSTGFSSTYTLTTDIVAS